MKNAAYTQEFSTTQHGETIKSPAENAVFPMSLNQREIAERAYYAYLDHGRPEGHDLDHWLEAEAHKCHGRSTSWSTIIAARQDERLT